MEIALCDIVVYVISPGKHKYRERLNISFSRLVDMGFKKIIYRKSVEDEKNARSLALTVGEILREALPPFIIVEDDINIFQMEKVIKIPENAAAVYLGVSMWVFPFSSQYIENKRCNIRRSIPIDFQNFDAKMVRIVGMTGAHAILYLDTTFKDKLVSKIDENADIPHDLYLAVLQQEFPIYALKNPIFYQDIRLGGQEQETLLRWHNGNYISVNQR